LCVCVLCKKARIDAVPQIFIRSLISMYLLEPLPAHRSESGPIRINTHKNFHIYVLFTSIFCTWLNRKMDIFQTDLIVSIAEIYIFINMKLSILR